MHTDDDLKRPHPHKSRVVASLQNFWRLLIYFFFLRPLLSPSSASSRLSRHSPSLHEHLHACFRRHKSRFCLAWAIQSAHLSFAFCLLSVELETGDETRIGPAEAEFTVQLLTWAHPYCGLPSTHLVPSLTMKNESKPEIYNREPIDCSCAIVSCSSPITVRSCIYAPHQFRIE